VRTTIDNLRARQGLTVLLLLVLACHGSVGSPGAPGDDGPVITSQPTSQVVMVGETATFTVVATGAAPLHYQWTRDGSDAPGRTTSTFAISAAALSDSGAVIRVRVWNDTATVTSDPATLTVRPAPDTTSYEEAAAACAAEPMRPGGIVYYYCDCGTGAQSGCRAGSDSNAGTDPGAPRRTIAHAMTTFESMAANDTIALCKGGVFDAANPFYVGASHCPNGSACNDLREYTPTTFAGTAKPVLRAPANLATAMFNLEGTNRGGIRFLNVKMLGDGRSTGSRAFFVYDGAHDVTMCNLELDGFAIAVYDESAGAAVNSRIKLTGSKITNSLAIGYLGMSSHSEISHCYWEGNGSSTTFDHTLYLSAHEPVQDFRVIGNSIHGQHGPTCAGSPVEVHAAVDGLLVDGNVVEIDPDANEPGGGCYGMSFNEGNNTEPVYLRDTVISRNTIAHCGNTALSVANCPDCVIENNLILEDWSDANVGIAIPTYPAEAGDDLSTRTLVRNNTIWYGPRVTGGVTGLRLGTEGDGHVVANNLVYVSSSANPVSCFEYGLPLSSYAFIDNNDCYAGGAAAWVLGRGNLASWQSYAASRGFDAHSLTADPGFVNAGVDFTPRAGSAVAGKGNALHGSSVDLEGKPRPDPPAIGALEP
jgi:hypothetical protein